MTSFRYGPVHGGPVLVEALLDGVAAGSVAVREDGLGVIAVGRLHTEPEFRGRGVARSLMEHVLWLWHPAEAWLYASPYVLQGEEPGAPREALERFYGSLGFAAAGERPERGLMIRIRRGAGEPRPSPRPLLC